MRDLDRASAMGALFAAVGAASYGATIVFGRSLAKADLGAATVLSFRFGLGAALLLALRRIVSRPGPAPGERWRLLGLGVFYTLESTLFFMALERGTAAAVALLFYSYPAVVTVLELAFGIGRPTPRLGAALVASSLGAGLVVVAGEDVSITRVGVAMAMLSAATFALYLMASDRVVRRTDVVAKAAWVALGCAGGHVVRGVVDGSLAFPSGHVPAVVGNGLATAAAFGFMFAGLERLGASRTSVVMTLEAFFAIVLGAAFLGEELGLLQVVGGAGILTGAVLVASAARPAPELADAGTEPP